MQTSGHFIAFASELPAGVKHRHDDLYGRTLHLLLDTDRNPAPVINDRDTVIFMHDHLNLRTVTGQRLVNTVVDHFPYQMMKPSDASGTNIHPRPLTNRFQAFQDLNLALIISVLIQ